MCLILVLFTSTFPVVAPVTMRISISFHQRQIVRQSLVVSGCFDSCTNSSRRSLASSASSKEPVRNKNLTCSFTSQAALSFPIGSSVVKTFSILAHALSESVSPARRSNNGGSPPVPRTGSHAPPRGLSRPRHTQQTSSRPEIFDSTATRSWLPLCNRATRFASTRTCCGFKTSTGLVRLDIWKQKVPDQGFIVRLTPPTKNVTRPPGESNSPRHVARQHDYTRSSAATLNNRTGKMPSTGYRASGTVEVSGR